jgi:hypothetical protein
VIVEAGCFAGESVQIRRFEFAAAIAAEHVSVEAVQQDYDGVLGLAHGQLTGA